MPNLASRSAAGQTVTMRARLAAGGLAHRPPAETSGLPGTREPDGSAGPGSMREAAARSRLASAAVVSASS
jgi:hypothetical protein